MQPARSRLRVGDFDGAQGAASQAVERDPDSSSAWVALGDVALAAGRLDDAEARYQRAHQLVPEKREREMDVITRPGATTSTWAGCWPGCAANKETRKLRPTPAVARLRPATCMPASSRVSRCARPVGWTRRRPCSARCFLAEPEDRYVCSSYVSLLTCGRSAPPGPGDDGVASRRRGEASLLTIEVPRPATRTTITICNAGYWASTFTLADSQVVPKSRPR